MLTWQTIYPVLHRTCGHAWKLKYLLHYSNKLSTIQKMPIPSPLKWCKRAEKFVDKVLWSAEMISLEHAAVVEKKCRRQDDKVRQQKRMEKEDSSSVFFCSFFLTFLFEHVQQQTVCLTFQGGYYFTHSAKSLRSDFEKTTSTKHRRSVKQIIPNSICSSFVSSCSTSISH